MFFQINITPKEKKKAEPIVKIPVNNDYSMLLAPFQPPTRIKLNTQINTPLKSTLTIKNSNNRSLTVCVIKVPPKERCLSLNTTEWCIQPESSVVLTLFWEPQEVGTWRDILQLSDSRHIKYDVPLILTCTGTEKGGNGKDKKINQRNLLKKKICNTSNNTQRKILVDQKNVSSNNSKNITNFQIQPTLKRTRSTDIGFSDKENVSNNIGFNWMIEQARTKKQKKEKPVSPISDFSKFLNTSSFKFTPVNSKFLCFKPNEINNSTEFSSKKDDNNESLKSEPSHFKLQNDNEQTLLRKETYLTIPKYVNFEENLEINENNDDEDNDEFDDSLSPKPLETRIVKPQSEISKLFDDINFTPCKNLNKQNDSLQFSPNCYSSTSKFDKSKSFSDDSVSFSNSKNATFDINLSNHFEDNTYDLPLSSINTKNNLPIKPLNLAEAFDNINSEIEFSTPLPVYNHFNKTNENIRFSNQFSKSQMDFGSARDCLEADLWVKSKNTSISPISKNIMHSTLESIKEDTDFNDLSENYGKQLNSSKPLCIEISPPKKYISKPPIRKISPTKNSKIIKEKFISEAVISKKRIQINKSIKSNGKLQISGVRLTKPSLAGLRRDKNNQKPLKKPQKEVSVKLHDPNDFLTMYCNPDPFAATMTHDPFLSSTLYYDEKWMYRQELEFKKWLNALLTPPEHLTTDIESTRIDIGKVWQSCRAKEDITLAETKESVSARYHTNTRLNTLRKAACVMFHKPEVIAALSQTMVGVEKEILQVRPDKDLHRDIGLQKIILELFISYNPLWLRIGLETIYGETIPLQSNNDLVGLSRFLLNRFFSDPFLVKTHSYHLHPSIKHNTFQAAMNKFMLKKFLFFVYFLDYAKRNQLIGHDPCLFHKKALIKDSRSILLTFSREVLSGIGDVTKVLRNYNYIVSHKQMYLEEYDFAVMNLCIDLRDGVRLCRVMELITGTRCLTCRCRVPAISRLQKVHNVNIALKTLKNAGYTITGDIDAKSIADGHKEKTLSLLWQIIYKFQAPRFEKAATILQRWWRSKLWYVYIKKMLRNRKNNAASVIQRAWKCYLARQKLEILKKEYAKQLQEKIEATRKIQSYWRLRRKTKEIQRHYQFVKSSIIKIQKWWKRIQLTKPYVNELKNKKQLIINIQKRWRAKQLMKIERDSFIRLKISTITMQRLWRACYLGKQVLIDYQQTRNTIIFIQNKWRAKLLMRVQQKSYLQKLNAIKLIQLWYRYCLIAKKDRNYFIELKKSVRIIEKVWISKTFITEERKLFLLQKNKACIIQRAWKNYWETKKDVQLYKNKKNSCLKIQSWWRSVTAVKNYEKQRANCIKLQQWWRSIILSNKQRLNFLKIKNSAIIFQKNWKMKLARNDYKRKKIAILKIECWYKNIVISRTIRNKYLEMKNSISIIEAWWLALIIGKSVRFQYLETRDTLIAFQQRWRAQIIMKKTRQKYVHMRNCATKIQAWWKMIQEKRRYKEHIKRNMAASILQLRWRALQQGKEARRIYTKQVLLVIYIQRKYRANYLAKLERNKFLEKKNSAIVIQKYWRAFVLSREFKRKKNAVKIIEQWRLRELLSRRIRSEFLNLRHATIQMQRLFKTKRQMRTFRKQRQSAVMIQKSWRLYTAYKDYKKKKHAAIKIQRWRRLLVDGRNTRDQYLEYRNNVIKIQSQWRMQYQLRKFKRQRDAAVVIQKNWKKVTAMSKYEKKKIAVLYIENWRKHILFGRQIRTEFLKLKATTIKLQSLIRVKMQIQKFKRQRDAAIKIQQFWRSIRKMREHKSRFILLKSAALIIQRRYRARVLGIQARNNYLNQILAILTIQRWWKNILENRVLEIMREKRKWAVLLIENWWINTSEERRIREAKRLELIRQNNAATKIQAVWRGYKVRQSASKKMVMLRERAKKAAEAAVPSATLAVRLQENIEIFKYASNIGQLSVCLSSLDIITRLSPNACVSVCQLNLVSKLYDILTRANRSLPWLDVCLKDISILLTLAKFKPTTAYVLKEEHIELLVRLLTISVDKKEDLFLHTATLIWVLTEDYEYTEALLSCSRTKYLLTSLYTSINKKLTRAASITFKSKGDTLPSPKPDWGVKHKRPRTFNSISQAITSIASRLNILNIQPCKSSDMQKSFNFSL